MNNQGSAEEIRLILQMGSDEQFECMAPPDIRIGEIVAELYDQTGNSALDSGGGNVRAVIDLIDADNPANTKRINPDQTLEKASLFDGAILRISLERLAGERASPAGDTASGRSRKQRTVDDYDRIAEKMFEKLRLNRYIHPVFGASDEAVDEKYCFVIMSFRNKVLNEVYQYYVKPTLESLGFTVRRDDEIFEVSIIMQEI